MFWEYSVPERLVYMNEKIHVTVWNEFLHERKSPEIAEIYPRGIHGAIAEYLNRQPDIEVRTATLEMPQHGLTDEVLNDTDVLIWCCLLYTSPSPRD